MNLHLFAPAAFVLSDCIGRKYNIHQFKYSTCITVVTCLYTCNRYRHSQPLQSVEWTCGFLEIIPRISAIEHAGHEGTSDHQELMTC